MAESFEITKDVLAKLQKVELELLIEVDRICRKNNIKYSIMYGTLLGAVRNGGFIPWDDDCDVVFKRKEYEKFLKHAKGPGYFKILFARASYRSALPVWVRKIKKKEYRIQEKRSGACKTT